MQMCLVSSVISRELAATDGSFISIDWPTRGLAHALVSAA